ncbi:MAG: superoxide dismutase, Ni [Candidatus Sungbacteria bacterium]|nr:superoxide dismutase, Ni [Candidatus Sungbacteria bacterium]
MKKNLTKFIPTISVDAHCDIPCGVYDPTPAKIAAKTAQRMVMQINELKAPDMMDELAIKSYLNSVGRRVAVKENHAELCKKELQILWSDFFKSEHLEKYPNLHDVFWKALKFCSKNKQEINLDAANDLVKAVDEIAKIFYEVKNSPDKYDAYKKITDTLF